MSSAPLKSPSARRRTLVDWPLQNGDRLTRDEFHRRYSEMPDSIKAELIQGQVYMPSPASIEHHGSQCNQLNTWLGVYEAHTPGVQAGDNASVFLEEDNEPQPDALLRILPEYGGRTRTTKQGYVDGAPEFAAEIAASSASYDLHVKLAAYQRAGVREYLVWRVHDKAVDWFSLRSRKYSPLPTDDEGVVRSGVFPGLWLDIPSLLRRNMAAVLRCLQQGLESKEHAAFVDKLRQKTRRTS